MSFRRNAVTAALAASVVAMALGAAPGTASAATGDYGFAGPSYTGATYPPTSDKAQSKLWYAQGSWWADMFDTASKTWHIFKLDRPSETWVDTGVRIDDRANTLADVLWDGTHLYVASHVVTISNDGSAQPSVPNNPARLYRYSYDAQAGYTLDAGFPAVITSNSSESMTIDKDSTGTLWATWTEVSSSPTKGFPGTVFVNATSGGNDSAWGTPLALPGATPTKADDISTVVTFARKTGVLWSNELDGAVYWSVHKDGEAPDAWTPPRDVTRGAFMADDHVNIKAAQADSSGRVFAVVKTSLDQSPTKVASDPQIQLLSFKPGTGSGSWAVNTVGTVAECHTRPQLVLDEGHQTVHVFATAPSSTSGGCPAAGTPGTIYDKTAPMDAPSFAAGRGTPVIREAASPNMNDVTTTKQSITAASGVVVLASNEATRTYWHADLSAAPAVPVASFTATPTSGQAPLEVQFNDTSAGKPTSWTWDFGDGSTDAAQNPTHTYQQPGNYTVTLTASNGTGPSTPSSQAVTATAVPTTSGTVAAGASSNLSDSIGSTAVAIPVPAGVKAGDVLVAQITADATPTVSAPAGWTDLLGKTVATGSTPGANVSAYYHVVTVGEPADYTWTLSAAQRWGAGMTAFSGVDTSNPIDAAPVTKNNVAPSATLTLPGVTTRTAGAMLVGGVAVNASAGSATQPSGWAEAWESSDGQVSELAVRPTGTPGASGPVAWSVSPTTDSAGWVSALRPAAVAAPTASFTASPTSGTAPLPVQFTDTSTGNPTSWAWDFGDGSTADTQNPAHTYTTAGTYTVTLTATSTVGSSTWTTTITVDAASSGGGTGGGGTGGGGTGGGGGSTPSPTPTPEPTPDPAPVPPTGPVGGAGSWFYLNDRNTGRASTVLSYGEPTDLVLVADTDGVGGDSLLIRRGNQYFVRNSLTTGVAEYSFFYGNPEDTVLVGDWNGDGKDTLTVRRGNTYYVKNSTTTGVADSVFVYGDPGDTVLVGDWNGDGVDTLAVRRGNTYFIRNSLTSGVADRVITYGDPGDTVLVGNWNGHSAGLAVQRGTVFYLKYELTTGVADVVFAYGDPGDSVLVGDWNGDGVDSLGIRRIG